MAVRCANIWSKLVVVLVYLWFCSNGLVRNLRLGAGIGFDVGGLEMVGFVFGGDSLVADGPEMFSFVWGSGCCSAGGAGDGLVMVGFTWESGWCCVGDGLVITVFESGDGLVITVFESGDGLVIIGFSGRMCWRLRR